MLAKLKADKELEEKHIRLKAAQELLSPYWIAGEVSVNFSPAYYVDDYALLDFLSKFPEFLAFNVPEYPYMFGSLYFNLSTEEYLLIYKIVGRVGMDKDE